MAPNRIRATKRYGYRDLATIITVVSAIRVVIVFDAAMVAIPVSGEELLAIVTRSDPAGAFIRRTRPIARVPAIAAVHGVLITVYPNVTGTWSCGTDHNDPRRRRRSDANAYANLSAQRKSGTKKKQS